MNAYITNNDQIIHQLNVEPATESPYRYYIAKNQAGEILKSRDGVPIRVNLALCSGSGFLGGIKCNYEFTE